MTEKYTKKKSRENGKSDLLSTCIFLLMDNAFYFCLTENVSGFLLGNYGMGTGISLRIKEIIFIFLGV